MLSAYSSLNVFGARWAILAEIDVSEAFVPVDDEGVEFYKKYIDLYSYRDLYVINPDGYVFYTVAKKPDYQTNILTGQFKDSGLGGLVREVLSSKSFGIADITPYAASNGDPAAFIARPVVGKTGTVDAVVALQLSLATINGVMQQRVGMGETGETYLVGSDKLMRSDSTMEPVAESLHPPLT